jgi:hypothetical protein
MSPPSGSPDRPVEHIREVRRSAEWLSGAGRPDAAGLKALSAAGRAVAVAGA